ncbi:MAG: hypothetical protein U9P70_02220 [Patescibacteria group bacterium]|nr:hypothetical protein [Patescibacteria group bacterium]
MNDYNKILCRTQKLFFIGAMLFTLNTFCINTVLALDIKSMTDSGDCKKASQEDWKKAGLDFVAYYVLNDISLCDAIEWEKAGFNADAAIEYHSAGFTLSEARKRREINKDKLFNELKEKIGTSSFQLGIGYYIKHEINKRIKLLNCDLIATLTNSYGYNGDMPYSSCTNKINDVRTIIHQYYIYKYESFDIEKDKNFEKKLKKIEKKLANSLNKLQKERCCKTSNDYNLPDLLSKTIQFIDDYDKFADSLHKERSVLINVKIKEKKAKAQKEQEHKNAEKAESERKTHEYIAALKSGKQQLHNLQDALWKFNASTDNTYTLQTPIDGPSNKKQYYAWRGLIAMKSGDLYLCWNGKTKQGFAFENIKATFLEIRQNIYVDVVGRYVNNTKITLVDGSSVIIPVLTDSYVFSVGH